MEHEFVHDREQRDADRRGAPRRNRKTRRHGVTTLRGVCQSVGTASTQSAESVDSISLSFDQAAQTWLEALRFDDGSTLKDVSYGNGLIFWAAYPVELAQGEQPAADLYSYFAAKIGLTPGFDLLSSLSPGVLIYPVVLDDSVLYVMISDSAEDTKINLRDKTTGMKLTVPLASQHAALAVIGKREKRVVVKYGF